MTVADFKLIVCVLNVFICACVFLFVCPFPAIAGVVN